MTEGPKNHFAQLGPRLSVERHAIFLLLKQLCEENASYFETSTTWSTLGERMIIVCYEIRNKIDRLSEYVSQLQQLAPNYDFDEVTPGNGFRSLVCVCDTAILHLISMSKIVSEQRSSFIFRILHYCKELEAFVMVLDFLLEALPRAMQNQLAVSSSSLFPPLEGSYEQYHEMLRGLEKLDATCFFGRPIGFQFSPSVNRIFRLIGIVLASYSLTWERGHGPLGSIINTGRFFLSPEQRAERIVQVTKDADIQFCKDFWNLSELGSVVPKLLCPNMAVCEVLEIDCNEHVELLRSDGTFIQIPAPSAHTGVRPVQIRVLSAVNRAGMRHSSEKSPPPSPYLIFHCHGGGYVATSSKSHETYLRVWAKLLNCTIVSVEYSLAPENPFPRPTEEVLFAYAWILNHPQAVGWNGEKIVMVGDSAGGNLIMSVNLRLIQLDISKRPNGIVPLYTPFLFQYLPSPSRILSLIDPLLHSGVVLRCVAAYTGGFGNNEHIAKTHEENGDCTHRSLQEYVDQVQKTTSINFTEGSQSIVSLVKNNGEKGKAICKPASFFVDEKSKPFEVDSDEDDDTRSCSSVEIDLDPLHIQLASTVFDNDLLEFISTHPITKNALSILDEGEKKNTEGEPTENDSSSKPKRPSILGLVASQFSNTAPSTPASGEVKSISNSNSCNEFSGRQLSKRSLSQSLADTAATAACHAYDNLQDWFQRPSKEKTKLGRTISHQQDEDQVAEPQHDRTTQLTRLLLTTKVPRDPLISPMYADDALLRMLPPCYFIACHLDPLLDDTVAFARKLRNAGGIVASIDLLPAVPHGFLNFTLVSPECRRGAKLCLQRIKDALGFEENLKA